MTAPNKRRGNDFERQVVKLAEAAQLEARRAWGSDGRSFGEQPDVDLKVNGYRIQAKRRKCLPAYLQIPESCEAVVFKQDRSQPLVLISLDEYFRLIKDNKNER